jgi:hypothetical protein
MLSVSPFLRRFLVALTTAVAFLLGAPLASADTTSWMTGVVPTYGGSSRIAADTSGNIYAYDFSSGWVRKYTGNGTFLGTVGPRTATLVGLTASPDGGVYLADTVPPNSGYTPGYTITKYDSAGTAAPPIIVPSGPATGQVGRFSAFGADGAGNIYVLDPSSSRVVRFPANGSASTQWGSPGTGAGQFDFFNSSGALAVASDGTVYVSDATNRIQKFTPTGDFLGAWGSTGLGLGQFVAIGLLAVDSDGQVYAVDFSPRWTGTASGPVIQKFDSSGHYLGSASQPVSALTTYGTDLVYGMSGNTVYRFELTIPNVSISLAPLALPGAPTTVYVHQPLTATAIASVPFGSITGYSFDFGAGGPVVAGSTVTATTSYVTGGTYRVTVKATSSRGGSATASAPVIVNPGATPVVKALPKLSGLSVSPARFRAAHTGSSVTKSTSLGTNVRYKLSISAAVRFTVQRATEGRLVGARCVAPTRTNGKAHHCTRYVAVRGSFAVTGRGGNNSFRFTGRFNGRALAPGNYRLVATPSAGGTNGIAQTKAFTILR